MTDYDRVRFRGTFRPCQQRVLDRARDYLGDGKLHIVAAPGSGKTVLGLELIRRLGAPCLILSPTSAIRDQWGERLRELFLADPGELDSLYSENLHALRTVNSVTYQALYTLTEQNGGPDAPVALIRAAGIRTVCLDEAHHLRNEWYRALDAVLQALDREITVISLTATPPYDAEGPEWARYHALCGEIDEEIFVPELVAEQALCPHRDFVYLSFPTEAELAVLRDHRERAAAAMAQIAALDALPEAYCALRDLPVGAETESPALPVLLESYGYILPRRRLRALTGSSTLPPYTPALAEAALARLLDGDLISEPAREALAAVLKAHGLYDRGRVCLVLNDRLKRLLVSSAGKLGSIAEIAKSEHAAMGSRLRLLILADYIKKEDLAGLTARARFSSISVVSIFETLRRALPEVPAAVLSGDLVLLPERIAAGLPHPRVQIPGAPYCRMLFPSLHAAVETVGALLASGDVRILIGTRALLGEGWDAPCVNTLILASTVGSFVQSNQMRGRAIRIDPAQPDKTANIWHLATVTPADLFGDLPPAQADADLLSSYDFDVLVRRFDAFLGPNQQTGEIESGFERLTVIHPPFDRAGIAEIDRQMLALSARRDTSTETWRRAVAMHPVRTELETRISSRARLPALSVPGGTLYTALAGLSFALIRPLWLAAAHGLPAPSFALAGVLGASVYGLSRGAVRLLRHRSPTRSIRALGEAVYQALCQSGQIAPAALEADSGDNYVNLRLHGAPVRDQNIFNAAVTELVCPIGNPRYVLIGRTALGRYDFTRAFACPSALGKNRQSAALLAACLRKTAGRFAVVYTRTEEGRRLLAKCRRRSYINLREAPVKKRYRTVDAGSS